MKKNYLKKIKKNSGISMITLVVSIIVLVVLVGATIGASYDITKQSKVLSFINDITMVETKVSVIAYENIGSETPNFPGIKTTSHPVTIAGNTYSGSKWYYLDEDAIKNDLKLKEIAGTYVVNYETEQVFSVEGVTYGGVTYYNYETAAEAINFEY